MALSKWYADVVLPGAKASAFVQAANFSVDFDWENENVTDKISYFLSCDSTDSVENPKAGKISGVVVSGYKNLVENNVSTVDLVGAIKKDSKWESSSSSRSSESCSSSSVSSSRSFDPTSSSCSRSSISSSSSWSSESL